VKQDMIL